jgi:3-oxoacyl-[acyl-carrier protein] reductase
MKKIAVVTGGNSGIGEACSLRFAQTGYHVILCARREALGRQVVHEIVRQGGTAEYFRVDLLDEDTIAEFFRAVLARHGHVDALVNSAGIEGAPFVRLEDYPDDVFDRVMAVNVKAPWLCMKHAVPAMAKRRQGTIVNVASLAGLRASVTGGTVYTASKHALVGLTKSAAKEYAAHQVRINAVCPAFVRTPMATAVVGDDIDRYGATHPLGRVCEKEEVAEVVHWLCSEQSSFITGAAIPVDGGVLA